MTEFLQDNLRVFVVPVDIMDVQGLDIYEQMVYIVLRSFTNPREATAFPSYNTIAKLGRMSRRKAIDCVTSLVEKGLLKKEVRLDITKNRKIRNTSNLYTVESPRGVHDVHQGSAQRAPRGVHDVHQGSAQRAPEHNHLTKPIRTKSFNNNNQVSKVDVDIQNHIKNLLLTHDIQINDKIITKWLKIENKVENVLLAIQDTLNRPDIKNVVGYITKILETGFTLPKSTVNKELLPSYINQHNQTQESNSVTKDQQKEALDLLFQLQEINQFEYNKRLENL
jgi:Helix-turn-helix domain